MADRITNLVRFVEIGVGFYNLKTPFYCKEVLGGLIDIGTHMSLLKLESGRFIVIDTCPLDPPAKKELDLLTVNGTLIDGVVATHPFHTTYFEPFHILYPNLKYYGTPRHIRNINTIDWAGDVSNEVVRALWEPEVTLHIISTRYLAV